MAPHTLKDRQLVTWAGLEKGPAAVVAIFMMFATWIIAHTVWFPLVDHVFGIDLPDLLKQALVTAAIAVQFFSGLGNVQTGTEKAQKFMGKYTGVSFSPGIYLLPRLPFPLITLLLSVGGSGLAKYFVGWMLEDEVTVNDRTLVITATGMTREGDGVRLKLATTLVLRVTNAAVYLYQTKVNTDEDQMLESVRAQSVAKLKQRVIGTHTAAELYRNQLQDEEGELAQWIGDACEFVEDYGLRLVKVAATDVEILSKQVERAFDRAQGKQVFVEGARSLAEAYAAFKEGLPPGTSEEVAVAMFNIEQIENGQQPISINIVKFK